MAKVHPKMKIRILTGINGTLKQGSHLLLYCMAFICIALALFCSGCAGEKDTPDVIDFKLNLNNPEVEENEVTVNGGVAVPIERIQWDWGDGQVDQHHFFPASHTYSKPGRYKITVTVFNSENKTATRSVTAVIK